MSEQNDSSGCVSGFVFACVVGTWIYGALVVGTAAWEAGESLWMSIVVGAGWFGVLPSMVIEFLGDALGG